MVWLLLTQVYKIPRSMFKHSGLKLTGIAEDSQTTIILWMGTSKLERERDMAYVRDRVKKEKEGNSMKICECNKVRKEKNSVEK